MRSNIAAAMAFIAITLAGCFTTDLTAPPGRSVRILSREEPAEFRKEYKDFYLFYGALPIWRTKPEEIIESEGLSEVRVQTQDTVSDALINIISQIILFPQTVVIEGNYAPGRGPSGDAN